MIHVCRRIFSADVAGRPSRVVRDDQTVPVPAYLARVWTGSPTGNSRFDHARTHTRRQLYSGLHHEGEAGASLLCVLPGARARGRKHGRNGVPRTKVQHHVRDRERKMGGGRENMILQASRKRLSSLACFAIASDCAVC